MDKHSMPSRVSLRQRGQPAASPSTDNNPSAATGASPSQDAHQRQAEIQETIIRTNMETWPAYSRPSHMAQRRTDFAAATPWFHGVQTGFWSTNAGDARNTQSPDGSGEEDKFCTGLYLAGCPAAGRYVDAEVVISSINGADNKQALVAAREREMRHSMAARAPIGIAVSKDAARPDARGVQTLPCALPAGLECAVLGWFVATHMWEKPGTNAGGQAVSVWMVRLEKIDLAQRSWWSNAKWAGRPHPALEERDFSTKAAEETCPSCSQPSVRLFAPHFVCLNRDCRDWFLISGSHADADASNLVYDARFLAQRFDRPAALHDAARRFWDFYPALYPSPEQFLARNYPDAQTSPLTPHNLAARNEALLAGFSCPQCGLANSRVDYHRWHCRNTACRDAATGRASPFSHHAPPPTVTPGLLAAERRTVREHAAPPLGAQHGFAGTRELAAHTCHELDLGGGCRAAVLRPRAGGAAARMSDALLAAVQGAAARGELGLARRSVTAGGGGGLTSHFVENFGQRYYLPFALGDNPLAGAPEVVRDALETANIYMGEYFGPGGGGEGRREEWEFNELYVAAYLSRRMHMSFHDDGERMLGPVIGTWTLGGHATFKMCIKPQYDYGRKSKDSPFMRPQADGTVDPVPRGCTEEPFRRDLRAQHERGEIDAATWAARLREHMDAHMAGKGKTYAKRALVSFTVEHGDVVVMHGPDTQRLMEHAVECRSPLRFAVTLRRVTGDMASPGRWAALDRRLASDRAFTPSWAGGGAEEEEGGDDDDGEPVAKKVKRSKATEARVTRSKAQRARGT